MYLQRYEALYRSFFVVVELKGALHVVFLAAKEGRLYASGTIQRLTHYQVSKSHDNILSPSPPLLQHSNAT
jgi:hypothetical protein